MSKSADEISAVRKAANFVAAILFAIFVVFVLLALLALPSCIVYWWIGMSGRTALAIDIAGTLLVGACFATVAYYAD